MIGSILGYIASALRDPELDQLPQLNTEQLKSLLCSNTILEMFAAADTFLFATPIMQTREQWLSYSETPLQSTAHRDGNVVRGIPVALFSHAGSPFFGMTYQPEILEIEPGQNTRDAMATHQAIYWARTGCSKIAIQSQLEEYFQYDMQISFTEQPKPIHHKKRQGCVPDALDCALEALSFRESIHNALLISQEEHNATLSVITGALAESRFGVPRQLNECLAKKLPEKMSVLLRQLYLSGQSTYSEINKKPAISPINTCFEF